MTKREAKQAVQQLAMIIDWATALKSKFEKSLSNHFDTITIKEASETYGINENTLRTWKRQGKIGFGKDARGIVLNAQEIESLTKHTTI